MSLSAARLAWALWVLSVLMLPGVVVQVALGWAGPTDLPFAVGFAALQLGAATTGAVIGSRLPGNAVGWIFLAMGLLMGLLFAAGSYAELGLARPGGPSAGAVLAAWLGSWIFIPAAFGLPMFLLLLFPNGRFLSRRWRLVGLFLGALVTFAATVKAFRPGGISHGLQNPLAPGGGLGEAFEVLDTVTDLLALPGFALAAAGLIVRLRRSRGVERQQLKWFTYAATLVAGGLATSILIPGGPVADLAFLVGLLALAGLPVAAGTAILRYRLYDIDVVINRTLVYGTLTGSLILVYVGSVVGLQYAFRAFTSGSSQLAIVASTLLIAALFNPLRRRLQDFIDRLFYRNKYDARETLEAFNARLRDETDLERLNGDLVSVVRDTVQPVHVSLWLREPEQRIRETVE
ncbi:MAG: hypothetical protein H0T74_11600 [Rubrobacteraceae bacterium]|nr:hypothetical protein [Rubrobacteraceae bacterium]